MHVKPNCGNLPTVTMHVNVPVHVNLYAVRPSSTTDGCHIDGASSDLADSDSAPEFDEDEPAVDAQSTPSTPSVSAVPLTQPLRASDESEPPLSHSDSAAQPQSASGWVRGDVRSEAS